MIIFIAGQPGTGKTTIAKEICHNRDILHISTDNIKLFCRVVGYGALTFCDSHSSWKVFGPKIKSNIIKGYRAHNKLLENLIVKIIKEAQPANKHIVVEGVHITSEIYNKIPAPKAGFYLDMPKPKKHFEIFHKKNVSRNNFNNLWYQNYEAIKIINDYAKKRCQKNFKIIGQVKIKAVAKNIINDFDL